MSATNPKNRNRETTPWFSLLLGVALLAFIAQFLGFWSQLEQPLGNSLYSAANLLLNSEFIKPEEMNLRTGFIIIGQILGYIAFYGILLRLGWVLLGDNLRAAHVKWRYSDHIIVCSLNGQGQAFISNLRNSDRKQQIVVLLDHIESEQENWCQQQGVMLLYGDATCANDLRAAAATSAKAVIACGASTDINLQIAKAAQEVMEERPANTPALDLYLAVSDSMLTDGLGNENYRHFLQPSERLNPCAYNADTLLARWYFNQYPPHTWADQHGQQQVHLVFAGFSPLVEALICQYAKISPYKDFAPPVFTLLGEGAEQQRQLLVARYPVFANGRTGAEQVIGGLYALECNTIFKLDETKLAQVAALTGANVPVTAVLCCGSDDEANFRRAMSLHQQTLLFNCWQVPFYVRLGQSEGIHALLDSANKDTTTPLIPFGMAEQIFDLARLAQMERNARAVHEAYRQSMLQADPGTAMSADSMKPWEQLAETYRAANRRSGDHLPVKLASIGIPFKPGKPLVLDASIRLDEPAERRELLSRLEHRSWRHERLVNGWRYGETRNNPERLHPSIVLWEDLSESERKKDLNQIESVRKVLASDNKISI
ncbi:MAG: RyR domain-containing protein [Thiothrix sp.]|uniref:RyR domain-containing protein n=1 Tax=Thiothrix sp. TaxID=1032 RepID=UPI002602F698|nr:RyR domain-containing protein [Thiothrix sp.]MDD5393591.1 RyR domain-containing protein [Thiothrix sp.]